jgi:hypothetical protein
MKRSLLLLLASAVRLSAQSGDASGATFGGLGSVAGGVTNRGVYQAGTPDGSYQNSQFGLRTTVPFGDRLAVSALVNWREDGQGLGAPRTDITYLFATYRLSPAWDLRLGKVKFPNNLYSEVFDIGTLRPFLSLPQGIYGGTGNAFTSYTGIGVNGTAYLGDWQLGVAANLSGGTFRYSSPRGALIPSVPTGDIDVNITRSIGGRVFVRPPVPGLLIGISGATPSFFTCPGDGTVLPCPIGVTGRQGSVQFEYMTSRLWLRSEYALLRAPGFIRTRAGYAQAAWFLTKKWQVATQYDMLRETFEIDVPLSPAGAVPPGAMSPIAPPPGATLPPTQMLPPNIGQLLPNTLDRHRDVALGLNYWFSPDVVAKLSVHDVDGWRFSRPGTSALIGGVMTRQFPPTRSRLLQAGIQFNF